MSAVRTSVSVNNRSIALRMAAAACLWPKCSSIKAPDQTWPMGLAIPLPAMSGALPCTGSNIDGNKRSGLILAPGAMAMVPVVGQNVPEQVGADDHVKPRWVAHQMRRQNVDVELAGLDLRVLLGDGGKPLVPVGHRDRDAVRLGGRGHLLASARHGKIEGVAHDPIAALAREDRHLGRLLKLGTLETAPTDGGVFALVVLAHDQIVDVAGLAVGEGGLKTLKEAHGPQVDVLLEAAADGNEQAP